MPVIVKMGEKVWKNYKLFFSNDTVFKGNYKIREISESLKSIIINHFIIF